MWVAYPEKDLPVLRSADCVVAGGSLAGIAAALELARCGKKVVLIEPRTYLGREISAVLQPWLRAEQPSPALIHSLLQRAGKNPTPGGEIPLHMDEVKRCLEDLLLAAEVELVYASMPVGWVWDGDRAAGLVIGNKSGRQVVNGQVFIDATETALLARLAGLLLNEKEGTTWTRNIEFDRVGPLDALTIEVPPEIGIAGNRIQVHPGYREGYALVAATFNLPTNLTGLEAMTWRETETRERCMRLSAWLVSQVPAFSQAYLGNIAYELGGNYASGVPAVDKAWLANLNDLAPFASPLPQVWLLNTAASLGDPARFSDPLEAAGLGAELGAALGRHWKKVAAMRAPRPRTNHFGISDVEICEPLTPQRGRGYARISAPAVDIPVLTQSDVLVVGGGTSGAIAAYAAAVEGANTFVIEMNPGLGGTGTYGGVHSYWCGYRGGFVSRVKRWVNLAQKDLGLSGLKGYIPVWNMDAKAYALEKNLGKAGVRFLYNTRVIGTLMLGQTVCGVVAATRLGPVAVIAKVTVDASGDGDVAAFAGADFVFGSPRDHSVMWYILPQFHKPGRNRNHFSSPVDVTNIEDTNRAILSGRRRGNVGQDHDHGQYIATRESRHIVGDVSPSLTDHLLHRAWEDVVCFAFSNNDIKGQIYSEWFRIGLIPPHLEIEIPYRALLPKGLENILVVGKAVSTSHDALPAIRMQPDFENLGGAGGLAAALAVKSGTTARGLDIAQLQARAAKYKLLPDRFLKRRLKLLKPTDPELKQIVRALSAQKPLYAYSDMRLNKVFTDRIPFVDAVTAGPRVIPLLEEELAQETDPARQVLLAQALSMVGSRAGVPVLVAEITRLLSGARLPERDFLVRQVDRYSPDQAAMPKVPYLLFSLAEARDRRAIPVWQRVVELLKQVKQEDIWSQRKGTFYYVDAVCVGAEKLADPAVVPLLSELHACAPFKSQQLTHGFQADFLLERPAYLEVVIGRALARCGSVEGVVTLINYLQDVRALLAEQAHSELIAISGLDLGKDPTAWGQWLEQNGDSLATAPWSAPSDARAAWNEIVWVAEKE